MTIEFATRRGYASYQRSEPFAKAITLMNETPAEVVLTSTATGNDVASKGPVNDGAREKSRNVVRKL